MEQIQRQHRYIVRLHNENAHLKSELRELEHLMKEYTLELH